MASFPPHPERGSRIRDPTFTEAISKNMRIPEHLSAGPSQRWGAEPREPPPAYSMHVPDRLTYTGADMSPRPMFSPAKAALSPPFALEPCWESRDPELFPRESVQSPMRRSYSDQGFGRTPPGTPTHPRNALVVQSPPPSSLVSGLPRPPPAPPGLPSAHSVLRAAVLFGLQASQGLVQAVSGRSGCCSTGYTLGMQTDRMHAELSLCF